MCGLIYQSAFSQLNEQPRFRAVPTPIPLLTAPTSSADFSHQPACIGASLAPPWPAAWAGMPLHHSGHSSCLLTSSSTIQHRPDHKRVFLIWDNHAGSLVELLKCLPPVWEKVMWWGGHFVLWLPLLRPRDTAWHGISLEMAEQASLRLSLGHDQPLRAQQRDPTQSPSARQQGSWPTPSSNCHSPNCHSELCFSIPTPVPTCPSNDCWLRSQHSSLRTGWKPRFAIQVSNRCSSIRQSQLLWLLFLWFWSQELLSCCLSTFWLAGWLGNKTNLVVWASFSLSQLYVKTVFLRGVWIVSKREIFHLPKEIFLT